MQHQQDGFSKLVAQSADDFHHVGGVIDVQIVGGLVQQDIFRVLGDDHGDIGPLALAAGQLVEKAVLKFLQLHILNGLVHFLVILRRQPSAGIGKTAEGHKLPDGELHLDIVGLGQDGQAFGIVICIFKFNSGRML